VGSFDKNLTRPQADSRRPKYGTALAAGLLAGLVAGLITYLIAGLSGFILGFIIGIVVGSRTTLLVTRTREEQP